jgi:hypothetical protein
MDLREKIKRGQDDLADLLARAHIRHPGAADPVKQCVKELEAEGIYGETERSESEELSQDYASVYELLKNDKIDPEKALELIDVLDARSEALALRLAERMADEFGGDVKDYLIDRGDEK